jgi:hypothetical protein
MPKRTPTAPKAAYHRLMKALLQTNFEDQKLEPRPEEFDRAAKVFSKAGGTWEGAFKGSVDDIILLKRVLKAAVRKGVFTKAPKWG